MIDIKSFNSLMKKTYRCFSNRRSMFKVSGKFNMGKMRGIAFRSRIKSVCMLQ